MPPVIVLVIGAIGAFAAARWIAREARRVNAELHPERRHGPEQASAANGRLRRDASGVYRPE